MPAEAITQSASEEAAVLRRLEAEKFDAENVRKTAYLRQLELDIFKIDSEIARCARAKKGWVAATVIGSVGTVGTAIGAGVQAKQVSDMKKEGKVEQKPDEKK